MNSSACDSPGARWGDDVSSSRKSQLERQLRSGIATRLDSRSLPLFADFPLDGADVFWLAMQFFNHDGELGQAVNRHSLFAVQPETARLSTDLSELHLEQARLCDACLEMAVLTGIHLAGADLSHAVLRGAILDAADLRGAELYGANLTGVLMVYTVLDGADLSDAILCDAVLDETGLRNASLVRADLRRAKMCRADLRGADLRDANLERANLEGAILDSSSVVKGARLNEATLAHIALSGTDLRGIEWDGVQQLGEEALAEEPYNAAGEPKSERTRNNQYHLAIHTYTRLSTALYAQGLEVHARRFELRAHELIKRLRR